MQTLLLLLILALSGCASVNQSLDQNVFYKRDTGITVNGSRYEGVVVIPHASRYDLIITPKGDIDLLLIQTCHREESYEKVSSGWFGKNQFRYTFEPRKGLEDTRVCPMRVEIYESKKGRHSWAFLDFENPKYQIQATLVCNGKDILMNGVGVCQSKFGLVQRLKFSEPVRFAPPFPSECKLPVKVGDAYELQSPAPGECLYHFDTKSGRLGRFTLISYDGVLVRETQ